eukprot:scaffold122340_cov63-Phaeocystis_antarctica.AAC.1
MIVPSRCSPSRWLRSSVAAAVAAAGTVGTIPVPRPPRPRPPRPPRPPLPGPAVGTTAVEGWSGG